MADISDLRPLTREEQLEWYISFLEDQINAYKAELLSAKAELLEIKQNNQKGKVK